MKRTIRKGILALGGMLPLSTAAFGQSKFHHVEYPKPSTEGQKKDHHPMKGSIVFDRDKKAVEFLDEKDISVINIPNDKVTNLLYVTKLPLLPFHAHSMKHFLTIQYADTDGTGKFVVMSWDKGNLREIVAAAEAETGKKVSYEEECCVW